MLYCDLCDYFRKVYLNDQKQCKCMCEITGFVFHKSPEDYDLEDYPCCNYKIKKIPVSETQYEAVTMCR